MASVRFFWEPVGMPWRVDMKVDTGAGGGEDGWDFDPKRLLIIRHDGRRPVVVRRVSDVQPKLKAFLRERFLREYEQRPEIRREIRDRLEDH